MRQRLRYWSCSRVADWVRGEKKPEALPLDGWKDWRLDLRRRKPLRYFLSERLPNTLQNILMFPVDLWRTAKNRLRLRFVDRRYCLDTGLPRWEWHELDERIIHGLFNELKNFVEVELASMWIATDKDKKFRMKRGRCPEAGLAHLDWQCSLTYGKDMGFKSGDPEYGRPTPQAKSAKKIKQLYLWWESRKSRPDPMDESGWTEHYESTDRKLRDKASRRLEEIERHYEMEDDKMLARLIKVRKSLWT